VVKNYSTPIRSQVLVHSFVELLDLVCGSLGGSTTFDRRHLTAGRLTARQLTVRHLTPSPFYRETIDRQAM